MRRFSFIVTILLLTLVSCAESGIKEYRNNYQVVPERLTATFEGVESTRIELQELYSVWSAGDEVSVFYHSYENMRWAFQGETGDRSGELKLVSGEVGEQTMNKSYMLYPYSENNSLGEDGMLYTSLPAEQSYKANSYGVGGNIVVAESEDYQFSLKNVCGWIRIQLTGNGEVVHSITLSSNKDEALAGDVAVNSSDTGYTLTSNGDSSITLDCGEGVTLSGSVTEFYIGILPQRLEGGITVDIVTDQDSVRKSTYEAVVVERNHILPMTAFRLSGEEAVHSELRYTATAKVEPYKASAFNVAIVSNEWDEATGEGVITFDGELTTIGDMAFDGCESLTSVTIPDSVTTIGNSAFYYCDSLTSVTIPDSVTTIGNQAFRDCHSLTSVTIPDSITTIGNSAFLGCRSLTSVTIPDSVTTIGGGVFVSCHSLAEFNGKFAADGGRCLIKDNTIIAYAEASGATYTIPDSVTTIGDYAFCNCYSLTSVTIGDSVTTIGDYAFNGCSILTSVTIPDSVTTIGTEAFRYCYNLTSVYCKATTPPTLGDGYVFDDNAEGRKICVPTESVEAYKAATNWSEYAADIVGYNFETGEEEIKNVEFSSATLGQTTPGGILVKFADATNTHELNLTFYADEKAALPAGVYKPGYQFDGSLGYNAESYMLVGGVEHKYNAEKNATNATVEVTADGEAYTFKFNDILFGDEYMATGTCSVELSFAEEEEPFNATHTATKWLWSGASNYGNKYVVSGDGFTIDVHFPTSVATESSLATGEYVWMVTSFFSNSDATNFTTRSFKLGGSDDTVPISDGSAKVTASGDTYTIQLTLVHRDSGYEYMIEYVGKLNDTGEQGGGEVNPDGAIKLTGFVYEMDMCSHYLGYFWRASGENVSLGVAITSRSCTQDSINAGDYVYNAYPDDIEYAFQLRNSTYNGVSVGDSNSTMKVEKSGEVYKITIVASGYTFVYEGTLN